MTKDPSSPGRDDGTFTVAHLTTVDLSLMFLVRPQLLAVAEVGGEPLGISAPGPWVAELEALGIRHVPLTASTRGMSVVSDIRAMVQLWRVLKREQVTVLHTHNPKPGLYGRVIGRISGVPLVANTMHGFYATEDDPIWKRTLVYVLEAIAARFSDVELHQNPEDLALARRIGILPRHKGELLGNGVDLDRFDPARADPATRKRLRAELGLGDDTVVVGIVGRLVAEKGYPELFQAMEGLDENFHLIVIGPDDPEKADALPRDLVARAGESGVTFLGMRTDVDELYTAMDLFVLPSHREGFPRAAMEAAAMGLPIVATDIRGCRQVVDDGVNGLLVPVADPLALRSAIERLGSDSSERERMASASYSISRERFDERRVVEIVMESYRTGLIGKGLGHLLPSGYGAGTAGGVRRATVDDARALAGLHITEIDTGFLPRLGPRFMRLLYRAMIGWEGAVVLVADDDLGPIGFVTGVHDVGGFYRHFLRTYGARAVLAALPHLLRPSFVRRAWESLRYGSESGESIPAELLSMVVSPRARGKGLSKILGQELITAMSDLGVESIRVVVGADNEVAIGAYQRLGFVTDHRIEVHSGETSEVLVWRA